MFFYGVADINIKNVYNYFESKMNKTKNNSI